MATQHKPSAAIDRALDAYVKLMRAAATVTARANAEFTTYGLTPTQFATLEALFHRGPLTLKAVRRKILTSGGNMTLVVDHLERDGLVHRRRSATDRRLIHLELTARGRDKIAGIFPGHAAFLTELLSALTPTELETLAALCKKLGLACRLASERTTT